MKAILVIDMPNWNGCKNCQFNIGGDLCTARNYEDGEDGCPLKPMPQKKETRSAIQYSGLAEEYRKEGWNDCIDEITGETE